MHCVSRELVLFEEQGMKPGIKEHARAGTIDEDSKRNTPGENRTDRHILFCLRPDFTGLALLGDGFRSAEINP